LWIAAVVVVEILETTTLKVSDLSINEPTESPKKSML